MMNRNHVGRTDCYYRRTSMNMKAMISKPIFYFSGTPNWLSVTFQPIPMRNKAKIVLLWCRQTRMLNMIC